MVQKLDFSLAEFTRLSWSSDPARSVWGPRLQQITRAWTELEWLSVAEGLRPCGIPSRRPQELLGGSASWMERGLAAMPIEVPGPASQPAAPPGVVVGSLENLSLFRSAFESNDHTAVASLLGVPPCCHEFYRRVWVDEGWRDITWPMALASVDPPPAGLILTVSGPLESNCLWLWAGVRAVPHLPCSLGCVPTTRLGRHFIDLGRSSGMEREMDWLEEVLDWPVEWSALHGIAEIKTPVLKVTTQTDATAEKLVVRRLGARYPAEGARGLAFPYRTTDAPPLVPTAAFRRGLENPIVPSPRLEPWFASDNGFDSVEAMIRAHQPIVSLVRRTLGTRSGSVLDLGCGNGALLRELRQANSKLRVYGIDSDRERIAHARLLLPDSAGQFLAGDLFEVERPFAEEAAFDVALLMPGRLVEAGRERALVLLERLRGRCRQLLVYAYGDWLTRYGDLEGLVAATPGLVGRECRGARAGFAEIGLPASEIESG